MPSDTGVQASTPLVGSDTQPKKKPTAIRWLLIPVIIIAVLALIAALVVGNQPTNQSEFEVHMMTTPGIFCNDGTTPGYYFKPSDEGSSDWVIYLPGGFFCYSNSSCYERSTGFMASFMTGPTAGDTKVGEGLNSANEEENPYLWEANMVELVYCSSDAYFGNRSYDASADLYAPEVFFHGGPMVEALFDELILYHGMGAASTVYIGGGSVGGIAVLGRFDAFTEHLQRDIGEGTEVVGLSDAGWYLYDRVFDNFSTDCTTVLTELMDWASPVDYLDTDCVHNSTLPNINCFFGNDAVKYLENSNNLFVLQSMFDYSHAAAEGYDGLKELPTDEVMLDTFPFEDSALYYEEISTNPDVAGYFSHACRCHDIVSTSDWNRIQIGGTSLAEAFGAFSTARSWGDPSNWRLIDEDSQCLECNDVCPELVCDCGGVECSQLIS